VTHAYAHVPLSELARLLAYNAAVIAATPPDRLVDVHEDLLEAADLLIAAAEYVEEHGLAQGPVGEPRSPAFLAPPAGSGHG
jgi:hypothetical protein